MLVARTDASRKEGSWPRALMSASVAFHHSTTPVESLEQIKLKTMVYSKKHEVRARTTTCITDCSAG